MKKKRTLKPVVISSIIVIIVGYLIYTGLQDTMTYYLTVSELLEQSSEMAHQTIRIAGIVPPGSIEWDPKELRLLFRIEDEKASLAVEYTGVVPDTFKPDREVVVEGQYTGDGRFRATMIMPKWASKYERCI